MPSAGEKSHVVVYRLWQEYVFGVLPGQLSYLIQFKQTQVDHNPLNLSMALRDLLRAVPLDGVRLVVDLMKKSRACWNHRKQGIC